MTNYFRVERVATDTFAFTTGQCSSTSGNEVLPAGNYTIPAENGHAAGLPRLRNQEVTGVAVNMSPLTGPWLPTANSGAANEETAIPITVDITAKARISVTLQDETGTLPPPTVQSCTFNPGKNKNFPPTISSVTWKEAWAN